MIEKCWCGLGPAQITISPVFTDACIMTKIECQICGFTCQAAGFKEALEIWNRECANRKAEGFPEWA